MKGAQIVKPPVQRIFFAQCVLLLILSAALLLVSPVSAYSALLGGLICAVPQAYFARFAFRHSGAAAAKKVANAFYLGETGKFLLTVVSFALVFALVKPLSVWSLFLAYSAMLMVQWLLGAWLLKQPVHQRK